MGDDAGQGGRSRAEIFIGPDVVEPGSFADPGGREVDGDFAAAASGADEGYGGAVTGELAGPKGEVAALQDALAGYAEGVLIDGDDFLVHQDGFVGVGHLAEVVPGEEGRSNHGPEGHVDAILVGAHAAVADFEHVGVIPVAGSAVFGDVCLLVGDEDHLSPGVVDVIGGTPHLAPDGGTKLPGRVEAVLAEAVEDGAAGGLEGVAHLAIGGEHEVVGGGDVAVVLGGELPHVVLHGAEIVLEEVNAPGGVHLGVLGFMADTSLVVAAGLGAGARVDAELEAFGMDVIAEGFHVGEAVVGVEDSLGVALALPGVVKVYVDVSSVLHAGGYELVGSAADVGVGDMVGEVIPAIPAHGWCLLGGGCDA